MSPGNDFLYFTQTVNRIIFRFKLRPDGDLGSGQLDEGIVPGDMTALTWIVVAFMVSALVYWGASYAQTYLTGWVGQRALQDLRLRHPLGAVAADP